MTGPTARESELRFPPGPGTNSPLGNLFAFASNPLGFLIRLASEYGDLVHFRIRKREVFLVNDPAEAERVLVTHAKNFVKNPGFQTIKRVLGEGLLSSEGEFHLRQRRMIQPTFHRQRVAVYAPEMVIAALNRSRSWQRGHRIDIFREMVELTLSVVSQALFSTRLNDQVGEISQAIDDAMTLFHQATSPVSLLLSRLPGLGDWRFRRGRARLDTVILGLIEQRRVAEQPPEDLLTRLIQARDEDNQAQMEDTQVRDEALTILLAGHETTATSLAWTWYLLSQHPSVEASLHEELDSVLGGRPPAVEDLPKLPYTRLVFTEALRLYPPIYMIGRQALEDFPIQGYIIPAGSSLIISPYLIHHDPRYYSDPEAFNPLRWAVSDPQRPRLAYLPFGAGPRVCIGEPFAWQEAMLILATLAQHWRLRVISDGQVQVQPRVTLRPKGGLFMIPEERFSTSQEQKNRRELQHDPTR